MASYFVVCALAAGCLAYDGTTQPNGTVLGGPIIWDGVTPYTPGPGLALVPANGQTVYTAPVPAPTVAQQAAALLQSGTLVVTSSSDASLNATYSVSGAAIANLTAIAASVAAGQGLPSGASTMIYMDTTGAPHNFTSAQIVSLGKAMSAYVYQLELAMGGAVTTLPSNAAMIP